MDSIPINVLAAVAGNSGADCWLQARTFAENGDPFPSSAGGQGNGPLVSLEQRSDTSLLRFGTDTGNVVNPGLAPNAICLPLRCSFTTATLEARQEFSTSSPRLLPNPFPEGVFNVSSSAPLDIGTVFTWDEIFFPSDATTPNPFYSTLASCQANAQESSPDRGDYFSFQIQQMIDVPLSNETCYLKIQIQDCFASNGVTVTSINPNSGVIDDTSTFVVERPLGGVDDTLRAACLPFVCSDTIQILVRPNPDSGQTSFCQITGRSVIVNSDIVSDINNNEQLTIRSNTLITNDYNDPNLGLYFDPGSGAVASMMAEQRCNAGTGDEMSDVLSIETGVAATFSCFPTPNFTCPLEATTTTLSSSEVTTTTIMSSTEVTTTITVPSSEATTTTMPSSGMTTTTTLSSSEVTTTTFSSNDTFSEMTTSSPG